jgi:soluble lytic murein transglycosylase-like protein
VSLNSRFTVVALLLLGCTAQAKTDADFLESIAHVESGMNRKAVGKAGERGMYQVGYAAWKDAEDRLAAEGRYRYPWSKWRDATGQDMIAAAHLRILRDRFYRVGIRTPTAEQLAVAWNLGFGAAQARGFSPNDYAVRVAALFHLSTKQGATK